MSQLHPTELLYTLCHMEMDLKNASITLLELINYAER